MYHHHRADLLLAESLIVLVQELESSIEAIQSAGVQVPAELVCQRETVYAAISQLVSSVPLCPQLSPMAYRVPSA